MMPRGTVSSRAVSILGEQGTSLLDVEGIDRQGRRLRMRGKLMGGFPADMYLSAESFFKLVLMLCRPSSLSYLLLSPLYLVTDSVIMHGWRRSAVYSVIGLVTWAVGGFVLAMIVLGIWSLAS